MKNFQLYRAISPLEKVLSPGRIFKRSFGWRAHQGTTLVFPNSIDVKMAAEKLPPLPEYTVNVSSGYSVNLKPPAELLSPGFSPEVKTNNMQFYPEYEDKLRMAAEKARRFLNRKPEGVPKFNLEDLDDRVTDVASSNGFWDYLGSSSKSVSNVAEKTEHLNVSGTSGEFISSVARENYASAERALHNVSEVLSKTKKLKSDAEVANSDFASVDLTSAETTDAELISQWNQLLEEAGGSETVTELATAVDPNLAPYLPVMPLVILGTVLIFSRLMMLEPTKNRFGLGAPKGVPHRTKVFVKTLDSKAVPIGMYKEWTVDDLKRDLSAKAAIPMESIRLEYAGQKLEDGNSLKSYRITRNSAIDLV